MHAGDAPKVFGGPSGDEEGGSRRQNLRHAHPRRHLPSLLPAGTKQFSNTSVRVVEFV